MRKFEDLTGQRFGRLTVIKTAYTDKHGKRHWECKCDCGETTYPTTSSLKGGLSSGCSRCGKLNHYEDLTGQRFGRLVVKRIVGHNPAKWECECDCGNITSVNADSLKSGTTVSCGCYFRERREESRHKHDESHTRLHRIWTGMKSRCYNPKQQSYERYGARGIRVCDEWRNDYIAFRDWSIANGYNDDLSIDRIDNDGNYEPSNCRWATNKAQARNKSVNRNLEYNGEVHTVSEWAEILGLTVSIIQYRLRKGLSVEETLGTPRLRKAPEKK